jgi:uncharacterized membrane protein YgcG
MTGFFFDANHIAIIVFGGALAAILFRWLVLTEDRQKYRDYVDGGMLAWIAFSHALYMGEAVGYGYDGMMGGDAGGDFGGGFDGGGGGCGGCGGGGA